MKNLIHKTKEEFMTHKNRKRNFLAGALATASAATLILGVSNAVLGADNAKDKNRQVVLTKDVEKLLTQRASRLVQEAYKSTSKADKLAQVAKSAGEALKETKEDLEKLTQASQDAEKVAQKAREEAQAAEEQAKTAADALKQTIEGVKKLTQTSQDAENAAKEAREAAQVPEGKAKAAAGALEQAKDEDIDQLTQASHKAREKAQAAEEQAKTAADALKQAKAKDIDKLTQDAQAAENEARKAKEEAQVAKGKAEAAERLTQAVKDSTDSAKTALAGATYSANANNALVSTGANWLPDTPGPANGDLLEFVNSGAATGNGVIVFDAARNVMLDIKGSSVAAVKVNTGTTATIGGITNSVPGSNTTVTVDIAGTGILIASSSVFPTYGVSNATPGDYRLLSAVNFSGAGGGTFLITSANFTSPANFTSSASSSGTIILAANGVVLSGNVGTSSALANIAIEAEANSYTTFRGNIYTTNTAGIKFADGAILELRGNTYNVAHIHGDATSGTEGILRFTNGGNVTLTTTAAAGDDINTLSIENGTALTLFGSQGIDFKNLVFTASTGGTPMLTLASGKALDAYAVKTITSKAGANIPEVRFSGTNHTIANDVTVGTDANNLVRFRFMDTAVGKTFTVNSTNFYGQITTNVNNVGGAVLNALNGKVYGLGEPGKMLNTVEFKADNITNYGDTYATNTTITDNFTTILSGTVAGTVTLGTTKGNTSLNLRDQANLIGNVVAFAGTGTTSDVNFLGNANLAGTIGSATDRIDVNFTGPAGSVANLSNGKIFSTTINFNNTAINLSSGNAALSGTSNVNANINVGSRQLTFQDNQSGKSTWGSNTSISTTVSNNNGTATAGSIIINDPVDVTANSNIVVTPSVSAGLPLNFTTTLISVNGTGALNLNGSKFSVNNTGVANAYASYSVQAVGTSGAQNLVSTDNAAVVVQQDFAAAGITNSTDMQNAMLLTSATTGSAAAFVADTGLITDPATRANAFQRLTNSNATQITAVSQNLIFGAVDTIGSRIADTALQVDRNELGQGAPGAGDNDRIVGAPMGAWLAPIYSQANQKAKGGNPGYKVKSGGGIFGLDTEANDNLVIGAAATVLSSDMKMKDQKSGDKAKINTFMFSLYGSQELVRNFFVQGIASFSSSKIKGKERRLVPTSANANGYETAYSNYNSMGYGGEVLLGYNAKPMEGVFITPVAGVRYAKISNDAYQETGTTVQNKGLSKKATNRVDGIVGVQVETNIKRPDHTIVPEAHAYVTQKLNGKSGQVYSSLNGLNTSFQPQNDTTAKTFYNVGFGTKVMSGAMEYGAGYDAYFASKYYAHQGSLKVRVNF